MYLFAQLDEQLAGGNRLQNTALVRLIMRPEDALHGVALGRLGDVHGRALVALAAGLAVLGIEQAVDGRGDGHGCLVLFGL